MHRYQRTDIPITDQGIVIQDDVWIGAGVTILDGFKIGHGSVIAAGAVVTKNIEPFSVMAGVPAHVLKRRRNADHLVEGKKAENFSLWVLFGFSR
jgi:acetyltransferase-like isoleucine patch superfamily enzyme